MSLEIPTDELKSPAESFLASVSEITESVQHIQAQQEQFTQVGCYFYRASLAVQELQALEKEESPETTEVLRSLFESTDQAKDLVRTFRRTAESISEDRVESYLEKLEGVIKCMGEGLSSIPSSTFGEQEYAEAAVRILSKEMQNVSFCSSQDLVEESQEQEQSLIETDLYAIDSGFSSGNSLVYEVQRQGSKMKHKTVSMGSPLTTLPHLARYMEPLYASFFCPLTKEIMEEPVTLETGVTYERRAMIDWFNKSENDDEVCCPTTGKKLQSRELSINIALKTTIEEWRHRNEAARIKIARAALSVASSETMVLEALQELLSICKRKVDNREQVCSIGMISLIVKLLDNQDEAVMRAALELLQELVLDDEGKKLMDNSTGIPKIIKLLSSSNQPVEHSSLQLLLELSKSQSLCEKIGSVPGGILTLITLKYNESDDDYASQMADQILKNLERSLSNIRRMADNGLLEPLVKHLIEGSEEVKTEMGSYLGKIVCSEDTKMMVAQRASSVLIDMVKNGNTLARKAAFTALHEISSCQSTGNILAKAGVVQIMIEEMFARKIYGEPMDSMGEATAIVANILESGVELESIHVNNRGRTMISDYIIFNITYMLKDSASDELSLNLLRILLCLSSSSMNAIVSVIKETEASYSLIEFINNPQEELGVAAIKFLIRLSPYMGHTLVDRLCKTNGQPENLIVSSPGRIHVTERQAVAANFLAKLPHQNLTLNLALLGKNVVPTILQQIDQIQRAGTRTNRHATNYLEGIVGTLVRFTSTLYEPQILFLARNHNFTLLFTELLTKATSDEVQRYAVMGLEKLSSQSITLSKVTQIKRGNSMKPFLSKFLSRGPSVKNKITVCPVHRGICSSRDTFCLIDANVVENLLACLGHEKVDVVEAALSAICTLLDDKLDVESSVNMLCTMDATNYVLRVVKQHRQESLLQKAFWVIEKLLLIGGDRSASDITQDRWLHSALVGEFLHGDGSTRQMAERILGHINQISSFSVDNY